MLVTGRQHDIKIAFFILKLSQYRTPEEDIIIALDVSHNLAPSLLRVILLAASKNWELILSVKRLAIS